MKTVTVALFNSDGLLGYADFTQRGDVVYLPEFVRLLEGWPAGGRMVFERTPSTFRGARVYRHIVTEDVTNFRVRRDV